MNNSFDSILQWKFYQFQPETTIKWAHHTNMLTGYYLKTKKTNCHEMARWADKVICCAFSSLLVSSKNKKAKKNLHQVNNFQVTYIYLFVGQIWKKNLTEKH